MEPLYLVFVLSRAMYTSSVRTLLLLLGRGLIIPLGGGVGLGAPRGQPLDVLLLDEEERVAHAARHRDDVLPPERLDELGVGARLAVLPLPDLALPLALDGNSMAFKGCF